MEFSQNMRKRMIEKETCLQQAKDEKNKVLEFPEEKILLCTTGVM